MNLLRLLPLLLLAACSNMPDVTSTFSPYRIDIRQGNFVTQEMVAQLKPGMTRDQVRFVLGTPLVTDVFHAERWDYVYRFQPGRGEVQQRRFTVYFEDGKLVRVAGDVVAAGAGETGEAGAVAAGAVPRGRVIEIAPEGGKQEEEKPAGKKAEAAPQEQDKK
ncbi:MAG: outer membrane protein assembly factor BamE [Rhodocyclaceae bacterium]|jgi:outer membrane protein assembly factor BamE|nr:outer membrane protein assembly factor BamE [Rhodocyclaceae bacterium]